MAKIVDLLKNPDMLKRNIRHHLYQFSMYKDKNFIGYDKYFKFGALHWQLLKSEEVYRRKAEIIAAHVKRDDICLDIGCGDGAFACFIADKCKFMIGIDADRFGIRFAKLKAAKKRIKNCRFIRAPISKISLALLGVERVNVIYSMDVIEHLPDPYELVRISTGILKSGGLIIIGTPIFITSEPTEHYHVKEYTAEEIRGIILPKFSIKREFIIPDRRPSGIIYEQGYYIFLGTPKQPSPMDK